MNAYERKQATLLISAIIVISGGLFYWYRTQAVPKPAAAQVNEASPVISVTPSPTPSAPGVAAPGGATAPTNATAGATQPAQSVVATTNPFKKVLPDATPGGGPAPAFNFSPSASMASTKGKMPELPSAGGLSPFKPGDALNSAYKLQGIVADRHGPMAVVSFGGEMLFLKTGARFGQGLRVVHIGRSNITIGKANKTTVVEVGSGLGPLL